jgi:hypothetical protein
VPSSPSFSLSLTALAVIAAAPATAQSQVPDTAAAAAALAEFEEACARVESPWPVPLCGPVVLVDPATRLAVANRPDPARRFSPRLGAWVGTWPQGMPVANTDVDWSGDRWAMAMLPLSDDRFTRLRLLAHESFHRIQRELGHDPADPMANHLDEEEGRLWLRLELRALARALETGGEEARAAALDGLLFRSVRHALYPGARETERRLEAHEGLAEYSGVRFALDATGRSASDAAPLTARFENRPTYVRSLGYGTGPALGLLLDRDRPGWRDDLEAAPDLAALLAESLDAPGAASGAPDRARSRAARYGYAEVRAEEARRAERMARERARYREELVKGPVLILELPEQRLMFNPNTVVSLGDEGSVYPGAILEGPWGRLTLLEGAARVTPGRDRAWVRAPEAWPAEGDGRMEGPGWVLELTPGWHPVPGPRPADLRLEPKRRP